LAATALLAAFLSGSRRFDRFVRIALCFHSFFLIQLLSLPIRAREFASIAENTQSGWRMTV
jgi:hypothetical protein